MSAELVVGSIAQIAQRDNVNIADAFMGCEAVLIVDCSSSMGTRDCRGSRMRWEVAVEELRKLQEKNPGKIAIICFNYDAMFCPTGIPTRPDGGTALHKALEFSRVADSIDGMKFVVISDGEPDDSKLALREARMYRNNISAIYCGPEDEYDGRRFLERLCNEAHGTMVTDSKMMLTQSVTYLLTA